jgi:hypothetical protein
LLATIRRAACAGRRAGIAEEPPPPLPLLLLLRLLLLLLLPRTQGRCDGHNVCVMELLIKLFIIIGASGDRKLVLRGLQTSSTILCLAAAGG